VSATRLVCWRHGRTAHNHSGTWQGQLDIPLDEVGREQAAQAARAIADGLPTGEPVTVVSSDLSRARGSAELLGDLAGVPVQLDARLREIDAGRWQGLTRAEIAAAGMAAELDAWRRGEDIRIGGGERRSEAARRCAAAVQEHLAAAPGGTLVVVGHGGVLRGTVLTMLGLPPDRWTMVGVLGNAHWAVLAPTPASAWSLLAYNVSATPAPNRFEVPPPGRGRLAEPRR
jgi:glucosyl-3-phosphoglycerate phosphatase